MIWISGVILGVGPLRFKRADKFLIGRLAVIFLHRRWPALSELAQICGHLAPHPRHAVGGLKPDSSGKLALSLEPIDRGHRVRNYGQQLGPQNEGGLDASKPPKRLRHGPSMPHSTSRLLWCFVGFCGDVPTIRSHPAFLSLALGFLELPVLWSLGITAIQGGAYAP